MKDLPEEILHKIFIRLPINQKQECMLVNRQWKNMISSNILYRNCTNNDKLSYHQFIYMIPKMPFVEIQDENLKLNDNYDQGERLPNHFFHNLHPYPPVPINLKDSVFNIKRLSISIKMHQSQLDKLPRSDQTKYLEELSIIVVEGFCSFEWLKKMENLKTLALKFAYVKPKPWNAVAIFQSCPDTVESLEINGGSFNFDSGAEEYYSIKELVLSEVTKTFEMDKFISKCLPYLTSLVINKQIDLGEVFMFPNHHFSHLELSNIRHFGYKLEFTTLDDKITRFYDIENIELSKKSSGKNSFKIEDFFAHITGGETSVKKCIKLVCGSSQNLILDGLHVYSN